jgi:hypothetical protein
MRLNYSRVCKKPIDYCAHHNEPYLVEAGIENKQTNSLDWKFQIRTCITNPRKGLAIYPKEGFNNHLRNNECIPYGAMFSTDFDEYNSLMKRGGERTSYLCVVPGENKPIAYLDGHPSLYNPEWPQYCWPGIYANEATAGTNERYNAELIWLDRKRHDIKYLNVNCGHLKGLIVLRMLRDIFYPEEVCVAYNIIGGSNMGPATKIYNNKNYTPAVYNNNSNAAKERPLVIWTPERCEKRRAQNILNLQSKQSIKKAKLCVNI